MLKANGITGLLSAADKPKYDEKEVEAYIADEISALIQAATAEERLLLGSLIGEQIIQIGCSNHP